MAIKELSAAVALKVTNLSWGCKKHFWSSSRLILDKVDFTVKRGEIFGFLGPNGAGKTTTIKAILGLLKPQQGAIEKITPLGFMPERPYFPLSLTGYEVLGAHALLSGFTYRAAKQQSWQIAERVGLKEACKQPLRQYSKGMLQRLSLGQAIIGDPALVILDEPLSGLDPVGRKDVRELIRELKQHGKTVFFSTHILPDIESLADQVGIMVKGKMRRVGSPEQLLAKQLSGVEIEFRLPETARKQEILTQLTASLTESLLRESYKEMFVLQVKSMAAANQALDILRAYELTITNLQTQRGSLEDVFLKELQEEG